MVCAVSSCGTTTAIAPVCLNGSWTCPAALSITQGCEPPVCTGSPPRGCTCDVASGVTTCADAGADAGTSCPPYGADGGFFSCTYNCASDTGVPPAALCVAGAWQCPSGAVKRSLCPPTCIGPPPPGCTCDPSTAVITCRHDASADAVPDGHGG